MGILSSIGTLHSAIGEVPLQMQPQWGLVAAWLININLEASVEVRPVIITYRIVFAMTVVAALSLASSFELAARAADSEPEQISGNFADGTHWQVSKPPNWNGILILDLDGGGMTAAPRPGATLPVHVNPAAIRDAFRKWMIAQGYAYGGTTRGPAGYRFDTVAEHLAEVHRQFAEKWPKIKYTLYTGVSRGGFAGRVAIEMKPDIFQGALLTSGGAGEVAMMHDRLNATFALKTLVDPASSAKLVNITDPDAEQAALKALVQKANLTPQGRARLALASAYVQYALWSWYAKPKPAPNDYDAQVDQMAVTIFSDYAAVRRGVEQAAGGNVSWNTGVDYADLLKCSGRQQMVEALYAKAGLDLKADLATLAHAPRISADPAVIAKVEKFTSYTGKIKGPVVDVDLDDPVDPAPYDLAYLDTLKHAGTEANFKLIWADAVGHVGYSQLDRAIGLTLLVRRLDTGKWGDTSLPALRALGEHLVKGDPDLGNCDLFDPGAITPPLFRWDVRDWDSYKGQ